MTKSEIARIKVRRIPSQPTACLNSLNVIRIGSVFGLIVLGFWLFFIEQATDAQLSLNYCFIRNGCNLLPVNGLYF